LKKNGNTTNIPLLEFDPDNKAIIEPQLTVKGKSPSGYCVMTFFGRVIQKLLAEKKIEIVQDLFLPAPSTYPSYVYKLEFEGKTVAVVHPGIGASLAAGSFDELIALGCKKFVACGTAGVLKSELNMGSVVIVETAVRDEGTSFHYAPPSREIAADKKVISKLEKVLEKHRIKYTTGKTWTTDGFYRETKGKVAKRLAEGCITVEMEASALLAVAGFRRVAFGQYLMAADDVSGENWDPRYVRDRISSDEKVFWLSVEACLSL
jgi:uridine phosphorylase